MPKHLRRLLRPGGRDHSARRPFTGWHIISEKVGIDARHLVRLSDEGGQRIAEIIRVRSSWRVLVQGTPLCDDRGEELLFDAEDIEDSLAEAVHAAEGEIDRLGLDAEPEEEGTEGIPW